jgi:molybdopterin-guanine dinucleotide biosynthesis protein
LPFLKGLDYVVLEGFETEKTLPKIIAAKTADEAKGYFDNSAFAISGIIMESETETEKASDLKIPLFKSLTQAKELADLVEKKAVQF